MKMNLFVLICILHLQTPISVYTSHLWTNINKEALTNYEQNN